MPLPEERSAEFKAGVAWLAERLAAAGAEADALGSAVTVVLRGDHFVLQWATAPTIRVTLNMTLPLSRLAEDPDALLRELQARPIKVTYEGAAQPAADVGERPVFVGAAGEALGQALALYRQAAAAPAHAERVALTARAREAALRAEAHLREALAAGTNPRGP